MGVNTNPDISAACTMTADGNILPLYLKYPESQIKHNSYRSNQHYTGDSDNQYNYTSSATRVLTAIFGVSPSSVIKSFRNTNNMFYDVIFNMLLAPS